jgi:hypothetical protein
MLFYFTFKWIFFSGKNVLEKPELTKILGQRKEKQRIQEWEAQKNASQKRSSLECKLEVRASKLKEVYFIYYFYC